jgi:hypothetical protein
MHQHQQAVYDSGLGCTSPVVMVLMSLLWCPGWCVPVCPAAGPSGRRSDKVGGFYFIHRDDLKAVSTLWLKYTEDVRADPDVSPTGSGSTSVAHERQPVLSIGLNSNPTLMVMLSRLSLSGRI